MKNLKAISHGFKEFELVDENQQHLGKIVYTKWYSYDVELHSNAGNSIIKSEGFWTNKMVQYDGFGNAIRTFKYTWKGFVIEEKSGKKYFLETEGFWDYRFVLKDEAKQNLMEIRSKFDWKGFKSNYEIQISDNYTPENDFVMGVLHCANYMMHIVAAASS